MTETAMETPLAAAGHKFSLFPKVKTTTASSQALGGTHVWSKVATTSKLFCKHGRHDVMESRLQAVTQAPCMTPHHVHKVGSTAWNYTGKQKLHIIILHWKAANQRGVSHPSRGQNERVRSSNQSHIEQPLTPAHAHNALHVQRAPVSCDPDFSHFSHTILWLMPG